MADGPIAAPASSATPLCVSLHPADPNDACAGPPQIRKVQTGRPSIRGREMMLTLALFSGLGLLASLALLLLDRALNNPLPIH